MLMAPDLVPSRFAKTGKRKEIFVATKFGFAFENGAPIDPNRLINGSKEYMRKQFAKSLKLLQTGTSSCNCV
jgi:aryl-alcohol dehydrogenase-like predicted oxidoreductase